MNGVFIQSSLKNLRGSYCIEKTPFYNMRYKDIFYALNESEKIDQTKKIVKENIKPEKLHTNNAHQLEKKKIAKKQEKRKLFL